MWVPRALLGTPQVNYLLSNRLFVTVSVCKYNYSEIIIIIIIMVLSS